MALRLKLQFPKLRQRHGDVQLVAKGKRTIPCVKQRATLVIRAALLGKATEAVPISGRCRYRRLRTGRDCSSEGFGHELPSICLLDQRPFAYFTSGQLSTQWASESIAGTLHTRKCFCVFNLYTSPHPFNLHNIAWQYTFFQSVPKFR